jgi:hypothetical protein
MLPKATYSLSISIARIRKHRSNARKPDDASRLVGWPSYPRNSI